MAQTYYEDLGVKQDATKAEIRSAYRKLVLQHHPDRSTDPGSKPIFLKVKEAYEVLAEPEAKRRYDDKLAFVARLAKDEAEKKAAAAKREAEAERIQKEKRATPSGATIAEEIVRLQMLYGSGRHREAESLAYSLMQIDPRQAIPYAVLADILRAQGYLNEAGKMYAYAAQMDPRNPVYQRKCEQLLNRSRVVTKNGSMQMEAQDKQVLAPMVGGGFSLFAAAYVAFGAATPTRGLVSLVSSWTAELTVMLFLSGVAIGSSLAVGNLLDRFGAMGSTSGRSSPTAILGFVAIVNFWLAAVMYVMIALGLRAFNFSTTRLMLGVAAVTLLMTLASMPTHIVPMQTFIWGGNLAYIGSLIGWAATDSLRVNG